MATTLLPQVVDQLVTLMRATSGYRTPGTVTTDDTLVTVFDSTEIGLVSDYTDYLVVGWPGDDMGSEQIGSSQQEPRSMAATNRPRTDRGTVRCKAVSQIGDGSPDDLGAVKRARDAANAILADVEDLLRTNPTLSIDPGAGAGQLFWAAMTSTEWTSYTNQGAVTEIVFEVSYEGKV